ncbi:MAG: hypothetical protein ACFHWZ_09125 [Phycisphaerales bacterium]
MRETTHCTLEPTSGVLIVRLKGPSLEEQDARSILSDLQRTRRSGTGASRST